MAKMMYIIAEMINNMHDRVVSRVHELVPSLTDKDLQFWIIGV